VNALFTAVGPSTYGLTVTVNGTGAVTSTPAGISCGSTCSASFAANAPVTLSAAPAAGAIFAGWSGACAAAGTNTTCAVTMSQAQSVGASFAAGGQYVLSITGGPGGTVTTTPGAIDCGTRCIAGFAAGTTVSVVARPSPGYQFTGWSGACTGTNTCDLTMNANASVQATFAALAPGQHALTVSDFGSGTITSAPAGISCGTICSAVFAAGTSVSLSAVPRPGYAFAGWGGACSGAGGCVVQMDTVQFVSATFVPNAIVQGTPIPTLAQWSLLLMSLLIILVAIWQRWSFPIDSR
jgi:uncharacterized repeat protein (TIGR02543 family)